MEIIESSRTRSEDPAPASTERDAQVPQVLDHPVVCGDGLTRCPWALTGAAVLHDHDARWGLMPSQPWEWFRDLAIELLQAGLAPGTALTRLPELQAALGGFDPAGAAALDDQEIDLLLLDRGLIRNRAKLTAVVIAARAVRRWTCEDWMAISAPPESGTASAQDHALAVSHRFKGEGLVHVGPGTAQRFLERTGRAPAHLPGCFRA